MGKWLWYYEKMFYKTSEQYNGQYLYSKKQNSHRERYDREIEVNEISKSRDRLRGVSNENVISKRMQTDFSNFNNICIKKTK